MVSKSQFMSVVPGGRDNKERLSFNHRLIAERILLVEMSVTRNRRSVVATGAVVVVGGGGGVVVVVVVVVEVELKLIELEEIQ